MAEARPGEDVAFVMPIYTPFVEQKAFVISKIVLNWTSVIHRGS